MKNDSGSPTKSFSNIDSIIGFSAMVCVPCVVIPFLLFIWHRYIQPIVLKFWNPWKAVETKTENMVSPGKNVDESNEENDTCAVSTEGKKKSL